MATLDSTTLGDTYKTVASGLRTLTGSATIFWSTGANDNNRDGKQPYGTLLYITNQFITESKDTDNPGVATEALGTNKMINLDLRVNSGRPEASDGSYREGRGIRFNAKITSIQMTMAHGEIFGANVSFEAIGGPTEMSL